MVDEEEELDVETALLALLVVESKLFFFISLCSVIKFVSPEDIDIGDDVRISVEGSLADLAEVPEIQADVEVVLLELPPTMTVDVGIIVALVPEAEG